MSISLLEAKEKRIISRLKQLNKKTIDSTKKEQICAEKLYKATNKLQKAKSTTQIRSLNQEISREQNKIVKEKKSQTQLQTELAKQNQELNETRLRLSKERNSESKKLLQEMKYENQKRIQELDEAGTRDITLPKENALVEHDIFFSYAHDDSEYADDIVAMMKKEGIDVVFDKNDLGWGESIIEFIDNHLKTVKFAIVLISPKYLEKYWTNYELKSLLQRHSRENEQYNLILPLWHNVTADEVSEHSFGLTDFNAILTAITTKEEIVEKIKKILETV